MAIIVIDGKEYDTDHLSDEAKGNLNMLQLTDNEIKRLQFQLAIAQTARNAYGKAVEGLLPGDSSATKTVSLN